MSSDSSDTERNRAGNGEQASEGWRPSRRNVLASTVAAGSLAGFGWAAGAQQQTFELGGRVSAWIGRSPQSIADQENPTLQMQAGSQYAITWENLDGQPHNVVIEDADGNSLVRSEIISEQGATQTVTFTARPNMSEYYCEVHPSSMRGSVSISGGGGTPTGTETGTETGTPSDGAGFFAEGTHVAVQVVAEGMTAPTDFAEANEEANRQFVTDQTGQVWIVDDQGRQDEPFIDVSDRMVTLGEFAGTYASQTQEYDERGLLGIDFHPDFRNNRKFYLHYSAPRTDDMPQNWDHIEVVSEFTASEDLSSGNPDSERKLLEIEHPQYNHDSGPMAFGPDGFLYVPMGDGGGADDDMYGHVDDWYGTNAGGNGQDVEANLLGSIIRIDVDSQEGDRPYGIPDDNPLVGGPGRDELYAWGFRNPFGVSFDSAGNLFVADAGQNLFEEADVVEAGGNYGWNVREGTHCFSTDNPSDPGAITDCPQRAPDQPPYGGQELLDPIVEFPHEYRGESVGITIIGGHRYEGDAVSGLGGKYIFGAWTTDPARAQPNGRILAATPPGDFDGGGMGTGTPTGTETGTETGTSTGTPTGTETGPGAIPRDQLWEMEELVVEGSLGYFVRMFGQDADGEVYVLGSKRGVPQGNTGTLLKIVPPGQGGG